MNEEDIPIYETTVRNRSALNRVSFDGLYEQNWHSVRSSNHYRSGLLYLKGSSWVESNRYRLALSANFRLVIRSIYQDPQGGHSHALLHSHEIKHILSGG